VLVQAQSVTEELDSEHVLMLAAGLSYRNILEGKLFPRVYTERTRNGAVCLSVRQLFEVHEYVVCVYMDGEDYVKFEVPTMKILSSGM
jgi:hypothetical protein